MKENRNTDNRANTQVGASGVKTGSHEEPVVSPSADHPFSDWSEKPPIPIASDNTFLVPKMLVAMGYELPPQVRQNDIPLLDQTLSEVTEVLNGELDGVVLLHDTPTDAKGTWLTVSPTDLIIESKWDAIALYKTLDEVGASELFRSNITMSDIIAIWLCTQDNCPDAITIDQIIDGHSTPPGAKPLTAGELADWVEEQEYANAMDHHNPIQEFAQSSTHLDSSMEAGLDI